MVFIGELSVCPVKHRKPNQHVERVPKVVHMTPISRSKVHIGQSGRCANERPMEHHASPTAAAHSPPAMHRHKCGCHPAPHETETLPRHKDQATREIVEALHTRKRGRDCVSQPSIPPHDKEPEPPDK
uniref:Uncharacterized protein n=1 Tax=Rhipicephalus zambeziensis TaxID=60191 RepID=A0A224YWI7_9ACAR